MAPPIKTGYIPLLPSQFRAIGASNAAAATNGNATEQVRRRPETSRPVAVSSLSQQGRNNSFNNNNNNSSNTCSSGGPGKKQMTEEQRLRIEYTLYLQQGVLNNLTRKLANMSRQVAAEKIGGLVCAKEIENVLDVQSSFAFQSAWLKMMNSLIESDELANIYVQLKEQFSDGKDRTLQGMRTALEARFNKIVVKQETETGRSLSKEDKKKWNKDLETVIERLTAYVSKLDQPDDGVLTGDNPEFLAKFCSILTQLVKERHDVEIFKEEAAEDLGSLQVAASEMISTKVMEKCKVSKQGKTALQLQYEETHYLRDGEVEVRSHPSPNPYEADDD